MIEVTNLTKKYGNAYAIQDLNFTIEKGQVYGFLGPNGAGKSTTMNILTGYIAATEGSVVINGHDILTEPREARSCIGYLPEQPPLYQDMTVKEYLDFAAELKGIPKDERKSSVEDPKVTTTAVRKDITNHSLGIRCTIDGKPDCTSIIIPKGTEFPCEKSGEYFTLEDNQTSLMCETLLGDNLDAKLNRIVGKIVLNDIPKLPKAQGKMKVVFRLSYDKTLHVIATNMHTRSYVEAYYYLKESL